jgi:aryl-alcohol dehydrogenase-like predicted oxidoreductase
MRDFERIGSSGLKLSTITLGSALTIGTQETEINFAQSLIDAAWSLDIRSFDTSNNYGDGEAETLLGEVLKRYPRQEYAISTKGSWPIGSGPYYSGLGRKHILWAFEQSISRLGLEYVDIYYAHRFDPAVSMEEVVRTFNYLINSGRILYWATSEWPEDALLECHQICDQLNLEKPILEQFIYSYAVNKADNNGVKDFCESNNIGMLGFAPLAQGLLTGKYQDSIPSDSRIAKSEKIGYDKTKNIYQQYKNRIDYFNKACRQFDVKGCDAAIQWVLKRGILPVLGASKPSQLIENVNALDAIIPVEFWEKLDINTGEFE